MSLPDGCRLYTARCVGWIPRNFKILILNCQFWELITKIWCHIFVIKFSSQKWQFGLENENSGQMTNPFGSSLQSTNVVAGNQGPSSWTNRVWSVDPSLYLNLERYIIITEQAEKSFEQFIPNKIQSNDSQESKITIK